MRLISKLLFVLFSLTLCIVSLSISSNAIAGKQMYIPLSASVRTVLQHSVSDQTPTKLAFADQYQADVWLSAMLPRLKRYISSKKDRLNLLRAVHYEAVRAGLDPELVLGLIQVESGFKKYAVSKAGARGYMQIMPFWTKEIGSPKHNIFHLRTNLRYGCTILRHYLDIEKCNLFRALGRYNGSLGRAKYPNLVLAAWKRY